MRGAAGERAAGGLPLPDRHSPLPGSVVRVAMV